MRRFSIVLALLAATGAADPAQMRSAPTSRVLFASYLSLESFAGSVPARSAHSSSPVAALVARARELDAKGRPDLAAQVWKQILLADPDNRDALEQLARYDHSTGDRKEAERMLRRLRIIDPKVSFASLDAEAKAARAASLSSAAVQDSERIQRQRVAGQTEAEAYRALQRKDAALADRRFHAFLKRSPGDRSALAGLGYVAMQRQDFPTALHWFELAERQGLRPVEVRHAIEICNFWLKMERASAAFNLRQIVVAETAARAALKIQPDNPQATMMLARIFSYGGRLAEAMALYRHVALAGASSPTVEAWSGWLKISARLHQSQPAIAVFDQLPVDERALLLQDTEFLVALSDAYAAAGRTVAAEQAMAKAVQLTANSTSPQRREQLQLQYATLCIDDHHYDKAERVYRELLAQAPEIAAAWRGLVLVQHLQGNDAEASKTFQQMPADPRGLSVRDVPFLQLLAGIQQSQGDLTAARQLLLQARRQLDAEGHPTSIEMLRQEGDIELQLHHPSAAVPLYRAALVRSPQDAESWVGLLNALHQAGENTQADAVQQQMAASVSSLVEQSAVLSATYFQTMANVEQSRGNLAAALRWLEKLQALQDLKNRDPQNVWQIDLELQEGWLQYNLHQDGAAEATAQRLREDPHSKKKFSVGQREQIASLTANLAVRRATVLTAQNNRRVAIQVLDAAAQQVGGDPTARIRLATGYLTAGEPAASIAIYQSVDMRDATVGDMKAAIGAAMERQQKNLAQDWLARALVDNTDDPGLLLLAGEFAQSNGNLPLAEKYLRASLVAVKKQGSERENRKVEISIERRAGDLLAKIESSYSNWLGATATVNHIIGTPGTSQLTDFEIPVEASFFIGPRVRVTAVARTVTLTSGAYTGNTEQPLGTLPANAPAAAVPMTALGGELQFATRSFAAGLGVTPTGFPVMNLTAVATLHVPRNPWTLSFSRDSIRESQLSYAGLHDPNNPANIWGGMIANLGMVEFARGSAPSGWYATVSAGAVTGRHVETNPELTGDAGAYWQLCARRSNSLKLGVNFYGQHNQRNELFYTYGHGGYFSPEYFLLPAAPLTFTGRHGSRLQYELAGSLGPQMYREASAPWFPLDAALEAASGDPVYPSRSTAELNYGVQGKANYLFGEHWMLDAFFSANNSDKYNQQVGGFSLHYLFRSQQSSAFRATEGFPHSGLRPYLVP